MRNQITLLASTLVIFACTSYNTNTDTSSNAVMNVPFGNAEDLAYADNLWNNIDKSGLNDTPAIFM